MGSAGSGPRRFGWLAAFAFLLLVISTVPALAAWAAESPSTEASEPVSAGSGGYQPLPGPDDVRAGVEAVEAEEAERERWLASPEAARQREESRFAYADLNAEEAQALFASVFAEELAKLNDDPARWLSDARIVRSLGDQGVVAELDGETSLLEAPMPVRTEDEDGQMRKVDLSLEATPEGYEPANPLGELTIPDRANEPIEFGDRGLAVRADGADGARNARLLGDKNVFYPEAQGTGADTDRIVSPTGGGVEVFDLLRSAASPEVLRYEIEMPAGAVLRSDGNRGAEVAIGGEVLDWIPFPVAYDAQGTLVPVELEIEDGAIVLRIAHREADLAYPILIDPVHIWEDWVNQNWFDGYNTYALDIGAWQYAENWSWIEGETHCINKCWGYRGLYVSMPSGTHNANEYGQWSYSAPTPYSYLVNAWIIPFWREDWGCSQSQYGQPHDYVGMWSSQGYWNVLWPNKAINDGSVDLQTAGTPLSSV